MVNNAFNYPILVKSAECRHGSPVGLKPFIAVFFAILSLLLSQGSDAASLTAEVNRQQLTIDESLTLTITADGPVNGDLELDALSEDFEVIGTSQSSQVNIVNGQMTNSQSWNIELLPRREGELMIPELGVGNIKTRMVPINVLPAQDGTRAGIGAGSARSELFLEAEVDTTEPYVQAQVIYTLKMYQAINILDGGLSDPVADRMITHRLGDDTAYMTIIDGRQYRVRERRFAIFVQESGELEIPPVQLNVTVSDDPNAMNSFFGRTKTLRRRGPAITLNVRPRPPSDTSNWWLPARSVQLTGDFEGDVSEFRVGESATRAIRLAVDGVTAEQLPSFAPVAIGGLKVYQDVPAAETIPRRDSLSATRIEKWAVIPQQVGETTLPEIRVDWFDTVSNSMQVAVLPAQTITVLPSLESENSASNAASPADVTQIDVSQADAATSAVDSNDSTTDSLRASVSEAADQARIEKLADQLLHQQIQSKRWKWIALAAFGSWIVTLLVLLKSRFSTHRHTTRGPLANHAGSQLHTTGIRQALSAAEKAVQLNDANATSAAVLEWASFQWPENAPRSLQAVAAGVDAEVADMLRELDRHRYSNEEASGRAESSRFKTQFADLVPAIRRFSATRKPNVTSTEGPVSGAPATPFRMQPGVIRKPQGLPEL